MRSQTQAILLYYGGAVIFSAVAVLIRWLLDPVLGDAVPLATLYGATAFAVWLGGYRPALLAAVLGYAACDYLFIQPRGTFSPLDSTSMVRLILYFLSCSIIIAFGEAMRRAHRRAEEGQRNILTQKTHLEREIQCRKAAEDELAESEQRFRQLAENINEVFWMANPPNTEILYVSRAYERVWGRSCRSVYEQPRSFIDGIHAEDRERVRIEVVEKQGRGEPTDKEYRVVRPDGSVRWVRDRAFPVRDAAGQVYRMAGIAEDITEKKQAEEAMKEADRRKDQFLATLAHELRNPLAPLRNAVQVLQCAKGNDALTDQAHSMIERQVGHMVRLIDDLLDISRITKGKLQLRKERLELASVIRTAQEASLPFLKAAGHDFIVTLPDEPIYLDADPVRLAQVLSNLLNNAAKYTEKGGRIQLTVQRQAQKAVIAVRDSGIGIAAENLPQLFEAFSQIVPTSERSQGGLGVGLSLVKGLVELHGGNVEAQSDGIGKGSEFIVRLPIADIPVPALPGPAAGEKPPCGPKRRILVVDDNRDTADSLATILQLMGHDTEMAHDGLEAVRAAAAFRPDVVLLDIGLPQIDGYEAARRIRAQQGRSDMLVVALTGWGQEEDKRRALEAGFDHHLTKPIGIEVLQQVLALAKPHLSKSSSNGEHACD